MAAKEIIMQNKKKAIEQLPESVASESEAGKFWDTHSLAEHEELLEPADVKFEVSKRVFEVRVAEDVFQKLRHEAEVSQQSLPTTVDRLLRKELSLDK
jgi:predicted HicB family RNase H-like nuclease